MHLRAILWSASVAVSGAAFGLSWLTQTVELPVWALLALTFIPTREITDGLRQPFSRLNGDSDG